MKNFTISVSILALLMIGVSALYIFKLPPFDALKNPAEALSPDSQSSIFNSPIPASQKVKRKLSYAELMIKAKNLQENRFYTLAIKEYAQASLKEPQKFEPLLEIALIHLKNHSYDKALENFKQLNQQFPENIAIQIHLLESYIAAEKFSEAKEAAKLMTAENAELFYFKGLLAAFFKEHDQAKTFFNKVKSLGPEEHILKSTDAILLSYQTLDSAKDIKEEYRMTVLAKHFNEAGQFPLALKTLDEVTKNIPDYRDAWILLGYAELNLEKYLESLSSFEKALAIDPQRPEIRYFIGLAHFGLDHTLEAITNLEIALENGYEPKMEIYQKLAEMYLIEKDYASALAFYERVLENQQREVDYYIRPVWILVDHLKSPKKCIDLATRAVNNHPDQAMAYNLLGWCYIAAEKYPEAKIHLEKALTLNPGLAAAHLNLGKLYEALNNPEEAKSSYQKAYELEPGSAVGNLAAKRYNEILNENR